MPVKNQTGIYHYSSQKIFSKQITILQTTFDEIPEKYSSNYRSPLFPSHISLLY